MKYWKTTSDTYHNTNAWSNKRHDAGKAALVTGRSGMGLAHHNFLPIFDDGGYSQFAKISNIELSPAYTKLGALRLL